MKQTVRSFWLTSAGLLLILPTVYFICISIFKYEPARLECKSAHFVEAGVWWFAYTIPGLKNRMAFY
ncbi:MAG TPA: hypothetical protein VF487_01600 [Chitinophagaceae bacterium]